MPRDPVERWHDLGSFIREQRAGARLSLRRLSELAGISNPYLSQIERGLRRPSADILQQIAKALRISAETLYVQAGILDPPSGGPDLVEHIRADPHLGESQKQALVEIYLSFRRERDAYRRHDAPEAQRATQRATQRVTQRATQRTTQRATQRASGTPRRGATPGGGRRSDR